MEGYQAHYNHQRANHRVSSLSRTPVHGTRPRSDGATPQGDVSCSAWKRSRANASEPTAPIDRRSICMTPKSRQWENKDLMKFSVALVFICLMRL
jgi:hypothetical protein